MSDELPLIVSDGRWGCGGMRSQCMWDDTFTVERIEIDPELAARIRYKLNSVGDIWTTNEGWDNQYPEPVADIKRVSKELQKGAFDK